MAEENSKAERDTVMDLSLCYQKGQKESNCFTYLIWVPVNRKKRKVIFLWCLNTGKRRKIICPRNETL